MFVCPFLTFSPSSRRRSRDVLSVLCSSSGPPDSNSCSWSCSWLSSSAPSAVDRDLFRGAFTRPGEQSTASCYGGLSGEVALQEEDFGANKGNQATRKSLVTRHLADTTRLPRYRLHTFDSCDGVLSVLGLMLCGLSLCGVLHRVLVHTRVSRQ